MKLIQINDQIEDTETWVLQHPQNKEGQLICLCVRSNRYVQYLHGLSEDKLHPLKRTWTKYEYFSTSLNPKEWIFTRENEDEKEILILREYGRFNLKTGKVSYY